MANDADINSTQWAALIALFLVFLVPIAVALAWWFKQRYARAIVQPAGQCGGRIGGIGCRGASRQRDARGGPGVDRPTAGHSSHARGVDQGGR